MAEYSAFFNISQSPSSFSSSLGPLSPTILQSNTDPTFKKGCSLLESESPPPSSLLAVSFCLLSCCCFLKRGRLSRPRSGQQQQNTNRRRRRRRGGEKRPKNTLKEGGRVQLKSLSGTPSLWGHLLLVGFVYVPGQLFGFVLSGCPGDDRLDTVCMCGSLRFVLNECIRLWICLYLCVCEALSRRCWFILHLKDERWLQSEVTAPSP